MPSPFPGVDPYLEPQGFWQEPVLLQVARRRQVDPTLQDRYSARDFSTYFAPSASEQLDEILPKGYSAQLQQKPGIADVTEPECERIIPYVLEVGGKRRITERNSRLRDRAGIGAIEPVTMRLPCRYIEVLDHGIEIRRGTQRKPIAMIEILTPAKKDGAGRGEYSAKRRKLFRQKVHRIELDLLLDGERLSMGAELPPGDFYAIVSRVENRPVSDVYAWTIRDRPPTIPIPLSRPDPDVMLDLGAVFTTANDRGRFDRSVDDSTSPSAVKKPADRAWAERPAKAARR